MDQSFRVQSISNFKRYQDQLRSKVQQTQNMVLENKKDEQSLNRLNISIQDEQRIIKYLQVQICRMQPKVKQIYIKNILQRYKKKIKQHKQYINAYYGHNAYQSNNKYDFKNIARLEHHNLQLQTNKITMYQNQSLQNQMGYNIKNQGLQLNNGFNHHKNIRSQLDQADNSIGLIQKSILKRKLMFLSLIILFIIAIIIIIIRKVNKVVDIVK